MSQGGREDELYGCLQENGCVAHLRALLHGLLMALPQHLCTLLQGRWQLIIEEVLGLSQLLILIELSELLKDAAAIRSRLLVVIAHPAAGH